MKKNALILTAILAASFIFSACSHHTMDDDNDKEMMNEKQNTMTMPENSMKNETMKKVDMMDDGMKKTDNTM